MGVATKLIAGLHKFVLRVYSIYTQGKATVRDPVKIWELGMEAILRLTSLCCILPLTVSTPDQDGIRTLSAPRTARRQCVKYVPNIIIALRLAYYISVSFDGHLKWMVGGQFTADSTVFVIILLVASGSYAIHCMLLYYAVDFAFLRNSVVKLNRTFSGTVVRSCMKLVVRFLKII